MRNRALLIASTALVASTSGYAAQYLTIKQAQNVLFPGAELVSIPITLTQQQLRGIEKQCQVRAEVPFLRAWRTKTGAWFITDHVIGKHEFIDYACGIDAKGTVVGVEILTYRESYGQEVAGKWRQQFRTKTAADPVTLERDIRNISGATLSCRHVTDGVKRLLATYELVLKSIR